MRRIRERQPQTQSPVAAVPGALSDYEVCAQSFPGEQGYPLNRAAAQTSGRLGGVKRYCRANVCVLRNDTYLEYCRQNFQTTNEVLALTGRGYEAGFCYSGSCSVLMFPYLRRILPLRFGTLLG
ncbi:hypothetical protein HPB48_017922 [Haemaphysalis longicornis]|uniref:Uncharacterized protein n=1 Tax=Haemaphysalis longicornis TaxID=44386 RepID=A0A9J6GSD8_HAELO|nr:hypothetical protein HPB48_017922 [Haemaphysalis longicornis]